VQLVARHLSTTILLQLATNEEQVLAEAVSAAPLISQPVAMMIARVRFMLFPYH
jgi:hypothetical protein